MSVSNQMILGWLESFVQSKFCLKIPDQTHKWWIQNKNICSQCEHVAIHFFPAKFVCEVCTKGPLSGYIFTALQKDLKH